MAKIVIIEDALDTRELMKLVLEMEGHTVDFAENAEDGLEKIRQMRPQVILMDISLPGNMSGLDIVRKLRNDDEFKDTPILAVTAHAMNNDRKNSLAAGCDEHITKPIFDLEEFSEKVAKYAKEGRKKEAGNQ